MDLEVHDFQTDLNKVSFAVLRMYRNDAHKSNVPRPREHGKEDEKDEIRGSSTSLRL